jgi:hypothetical protein
MDTCGGDRATAAGAERGFRSTVLLLAIDEVRNVFRRSRLYNVDAGGEPNSSSSF